MQFLVQLLPFVLIFVVFWFFLIRPQRQKQQKHEDMLDDLTVGDQVVTIGGIKGKIIKIKDEMVRLRISSSVDIDLMKNAIGHLADEDKNKQQDQQEQNQDQG